MHEKQLTLDEYDAAVERLHASGIDFRTWSWRDGAGEWTASFLRSSVLPALYRRTDRHGAETYWTDEVPVIARPTPAVPQLGEAFSIVVDVAARTYSRGEWEGDERVSVQCTEGPVGTWHFALDCYYASRAIFELKLTQPWERAVQTLLAALRYDTEAETGVAP